MGRQIALTGGLQFRRGGSANSMLWHVDRADTPEPAASTLCSRTVSGPKRDQPPVGADICPKCLRVLKERIEEARATLKTTLHAVERLGLKKDGIV